MEVKRVLIEIVLVISLLLLVAGLVSVFNTLIPPESAGLLGGVIGVSSVQVLVGRLKFL